MEYEKIILDLMTRVVNLEEQVAILMNEKNGNEKPVAKQPGINEIKTYITSLKEAGRKNGKHFIILKSNDIHEALKLRSRMPTVCNAMRQCMSINDRIIHETESGYSSTFEVRYELGG